MPPGGGGAKPEARNRGPKPRPEMKSNGSCVVCMIATLFEPHVSAGRDFFHRVHNATRVDFPTMFDESVFPNPYAAAMYDAIILFAIVANQQRWRPEQGGRAFLNQSSGNLSFQGATGLVQLDANGDALLSYQAVNLVLKNGALQRIAVGVSTAGTQSYSSNGIPIIWPGGLLSVPADAAVAVADGFDTTWILIGGGVSAVVVVAGVTILVRKRHAHLQAIMMQLFTEVSPVSPRFLQRLPLSSQSAQPPVRFVHLSRGHPRYHLYGVWFLSCFWIVQEHIDQYIAKQAGIRADSANAT